MSGQRDNCTTNDFADNCRPKTGCDADRADRCATGRDPGTGSGYAYGAINYRPETGNNDDCADCCATGDTGADSRNAPGRRAVRNRGPSQGALSRRHCRMGQPRLKGLSLRRIQGLRQNEERRVYV